MRTTAARILVWFLMLTAVHAFAQSKQWEIQLTNGLTLTADSVTEEGENYRYTSDGRSGSIPKYSVLQITEQPKEENPFGKQPNPADPFGKAHAPFPETARDRIIQRIGVGLLTGLGLAACILVLTAIYRGVKGALVRLQEIVGSSQRPGADARRWRNGCCAGWLATTTRVSRLL